MPIGKNPYAPKIPCHRVIRSDGGLGGYSEEVEGKKQKKNCLKWKVYPSRIVYFQQFFQISI